MVTFDKLNHYPEELLGHYPNFEALLAAVKGYLIFIAKNKKTVTTEELCERLSIPLSRSSKLFDRLFTHFDEEFLPLKILPSVLLVSKVHGTAKKHFYQYMDFEEYSEKPELGFDYNRNIEWHRQLFYRRHLEKVWEFFNETNV